MFSVILIILAAICNALMDTVTHHYSTSIFKYCNRKFYDPNVSWEWAVNFYGYKFDFWHICKTLMLFFLMAAVVNYKPISANWFTTMTPFATTFLDWCLLGTLWNIVFGLMYDKILR